MLSEPPSTDAQTSPYSRGNQVNISKFRARPSVAREVSLRVQARLQQSDFFIHSTEPSAKLSDC